MLIVIATTDSKYIGLTAPIDPRNPPLSIPMADGSIFHPLTWAEHSPGKWKVSNYNYTVWAEEV